MQCSVVYIADLMLRCGFLKNCALNFHTHKFETSSTNPTHLLRFGLPDLSAELDPNLKASPRIQERNVISALKEP